MFVLVLSSRQTLTHAKLSRKWSASEFTATVSIPTHCGLVCMEEECGGQVRRTGTNWVRPKLSIRLFPRLLWARSSLVAIKLEELIN